MLAPSLHGLGVFYPMYLSDCCSWALCGRLGVLSPMYGRQCWTMPAGCVAFGVATYYCNLRPAGYVAFGQTWYLLVVAFRAHPLDYLSNLDQLARVIIYVS
jgi:hypothetical protein